MSDGVTKTILLVEDEALIALNEARLLKQYGYEVITAYSGPQAIEIARDNPHIDLVLMDINLGHGRMDGTQAAQHILQQRDLPLIFCSSYTQREVVEKTEGITSSGYIVKNSGDAVMMASINMAFRLFEARLGEKEKDRALRESEERFRLSMEAAQDGLWDWNVTTGEVYYSPGYWNMLGYEPIGLRQGLDVWLNLVHPDDRETTLQANQACVENRLDAFAIEFRMRTSQGEWRWIQGRGKAVSRNAAGWALRLVGTHTDVTQRKQAEAALEKRLVALTRPLQDTGGVSFGDLFNLDDIQRLQDQFSDATGVASIITHVDGLPITRPSNFCRLCNDLIRGTKLGRLNCYRSDAELGQYHPSGPIIQPCMSGGLWDAGAAISVGGQHIANWLIGQVRDETQTEAQIRAYAHEIGADEEALAEAFYQVPAMSRAQFERVAQALYTLASQLSTTAYLNLQQARFIAESRQAGAALRESEANLATLIESTDGVIWSIDCNYCLVTGNSAFQQYTRSSLGRELHRGDCLLYPELPQAEQDTWRSYYDRALAGERFSIELQIQLPLPAQWREYRFNPIIAVQGGITGVTIFGRDTTDRRLAEDALRQSEADLQEAQHVARLGRWEHDHRNDQLFWSPLVYEMFEVDPARNSSTYAGFMASVHPGDREWVNQTYRQSLVDLQPYDIEHRLLMPDGRIKWVNEVWHTECDDQGVPLRSVGIVQEITERKWAGEIMAARSRLLQLSSVASLAALLSATLDEAEALTGSLVGFYHFVDPDQQNLTLQAWSRNTTEHMCRAEGAGMHYPISQAGVWVDCVYQRRPVVHNDYAALPHRKGLPPGHVALVRELVVPVMRGGAVVAILGVGNKANDYNETDIETVASLADLAWDIAERKRAEEALRNSEERYRTILETAIDGVWLLDMQGRMLEVNQSYCQMSGYTREELLSMTVGDLEAAETSADTIAHIEKVIAQGQDRFESRHRRKDGSIFTVESSVQYRPEDGGRLVSFIHDITQAKQAQQAIELALREKQDLLKELQHRAKNSFALITSMIGLMELSGEFTPALPALSEIRYRVGALSELYDLLYASDAVTQVALDQYCARIIASFQLSEQVQFQQAFDPVTVAVKLAAPVGLILTELITNALKHAFPSGRRGSVSVTLRVTTNGAALTRVTITVKDDGIGLPPGFDLSAVTTLGFILIQALTQQVHGSFQIEPLPSGTHCLVNFPIEED